MVETRLFVVVYDGRVMQALTREQIREIDRRAIEDYGMAGVVLMENAGRNAAELIRASIKQTDQPAAVCILCGSGNARLEPKARSRQNECRRNQGKSPAPAGRSAMEKIRALHNVLHSF